MPVWHDQIPYHFNANIHPIKVNNIKTVNRRRSIRLKGYDYSGSGLYFITICTWNHINLFGEIENEQMIISRCGEIAEREWLRTAELRPRVNLHEFIIMPNHMHGIIEINCRGTTRRARKAPLKERFGKPVENTILTIIRSYKAAVTKNVRELGCDSNIHIWQKNYFEHIIRNEESYLKISEYIMTNPIKWSLDKYFGE